MNNDIQRQLHGAMYWITLILSDQHIFSHREMFDADVLRRLENAQDYLKKAMEYALKKNEIEEK